MKMLLYTALTLALAARGAEDSLLVPPVPTFTASDPAVRGAEIASYAELRGRGWRDEVCKGRMTLHAGEESVERTFLRMALEQPDAGEKTLFKFLAPEEFQGIAVLTHERAGSADDQWLYHPSSQSVRQVARAQKRIRFEGTEFTYEDLSSLPVSEYEWRFLEEADLVRGSESTPVYRIEARPRHAESGYSKLIVSFGREHWRRERIEYFDRAGKHLKTQDAAHWELVHDRFWRALRVEMENHQGGKRTVLEVETRYLDLSRYPSSRTGEPRLNLTEAQFTTEALQS